MVRVVKGMKVPHGTVGVVFWFGTDYARPNYYRSPHHYLVADLLPSDSNRKIGIVDANGDVFWSYEKNVEVITDANGNALVGELRKDGPKKTVWTNPEIYQPKGE